MTYLKDLGMAVYDLEKPSNDLRLLAALAQALEDPDIEIVDQNVFLGQVRDAWRAFRPATTDPFPDKIIVQEGPGKLAVFHVTDEGVCYLPDVGLVEKELFEGNSMPIVAIEVADAKLLAGLFRKAFGDKIQFMSDLTVTPLVEGRKWTTAAEDTSFESSDLGWVIPILLVILANYGGLARGTQTKRFQENMDILRETNISFVENLQRTVWRGDDCIMSAPTSAYWWQKSKTLLCATGGRMHVSQFSEALSVLLVRPDLETALKLVLGKLEGDEAPARDAVVYALKDIHIAESQYAEVQQLWLGNLAWTIRLLQPVVLLFNPGADLNGFTDVKSEDDLACLMSPFSFGSLTPERCLSLVRTCRGHEEVGGKLSTEVGEAAELDKWNKALSTAGEKLIKNKDAKSEFKAHIQSAAVPLRVILRQHVRQNPESSFLPDLWKELEALSCPGDFEARFWTVPFGAVMIEACKQIVEWGLASEFLEIIESACTPIELTVSLEEAGFEPTVDPLVLYAENRERCLKMMLALQKVAVAWCLKKSIEPVGWDLPAEEILEAIEVHLRRVGYLDALDETQCWTLLKLLPRNALHEEFWGAANTVPDVERLRLRIGVLEEELTKADEGLLQHMEAAKRQKRMVPICGKEFECTQENFSDLWGHISSIVAEAGLPDVELNTVVGLDEPPEKKGGSGGGGKSPGKAKPPQAVKDLIGLAGEIHAYRSLLKQYGPTVISPSIWKSSNSCFKFPDNEVSDGLGCDFLFHQGGKEYHIEVKATQGEDESFELGSTEIRHAVEVANKRSVRFMVLHVTNALSVRPGFRLLPNPYDSKYQRLYRIEEAGLRVRYRLSTELKTLKGEGE